MATLTVQLDAELLKAANSEAERRHTSVDQLVSDYFAGLTGSVASDPVNKSEELIRLMYEGRLGHIDVPLTREEIYADRVWPRS